MVELMDMKFVFMIYKKSSNKNKTNNNYKIWENFTYTMMVALKR